MCLLQRCTLHVAGIVLLVAGVGCGKLVKVEGVVTLDGKPVEGATVMFVPQGGSGNPATGPTDSEGVFRLTSYSSGDGIMPGEYRIVVTKTTGGPIPSPPQGDPGDPDFAGRMEQFFESRKVSQRTSLPAVYSNVSTTPLSCRVPPPGKVILELSSQAK